MENNLRIIWIGPKDSQRLAATCDSIHEDNLANADLIVRAVNAFEELLAVAKESESIFFTKDRDPACPLCRVITGGRHDEDCPFGVLNTQHPGWREWSA